MKVNVEFDSAEEAQAFLGAPKGEVELPSISLRNRNPKPLAITVDPQEDGTLIVEVASYAGQVHDGAPGLHVLQPDELLKLT